MDSYGNFFRRHETSLETSYNIAALSGNNSIRSIRWDRVIIKSKFGYKMEYNTYTGLICFCIGLVRYLCWVANIIWGQCFADLPHWRMDQSIIVLWKPISTGLP